MNDIERRIYENCRNVGNIKIRCDDCKFVEDCVDYGWQECKKFTPKPSEPMTNETWFCSQPTEEKARFFVMIEMSAMHPVKRGSIDTKKFIEDVTEWLKQPHKEIEK